MILSDVYKEGIEAKEGKIVFDYSSSKGVNLRLGKNRKFMTYTKTLYKYKDIKILSLYKINKEDKFILRALKGESDLILDTQDIFNFIKRSSLYAFKNLPKDIDIILFSKNSYLLLDFFIQEIASKYQNKALKISQSIYKVDTSNLHMKTDTPSKYVDFIQALIERLKKKQYIKLRDDIPIKFRAYFSGYISIDDDAQKQFQGKNVLIVDDILTTGSTLTELIEIIKLRDPRSINALTIFKL